METFAQNYKNSKLSSYEDETLNWVIVRLRVLHKILKEVTLYDYRTTFVIV